MSERRLDAFPAPQANSPGAASRGFTLVEVAISILVITLLIGTLLVPLSTQVEQRKTNETQKVLDEIRDALLGFALANGYLPCPDMTTGGAGANDGQEDVDVSTGLCVTNEGNLPWVTLGVGAFDTWGNRFRYRVDGQFAQRSPLFNLGTINTTLGVCTTQACSSRLTAGSDGPPAVVLSHGRNGLGAMNSLSNSQNPNPGGADELENTDGDTQFVSRTASAAGSTVGEFDDIVTWLSREVLLNRMVAAGRLP